MIPKPLTIVEPELKTDAVKDLASAVALLKNAREALQFLRDLCTMDEMKSMATRWKVVECLTKNLSYLEIAKKTGASTATITRIAHWLHHGTGGYRLMLERMGKGIKKSYLA